MLNKYSMKLQQSIRSASKLSKSKDINPYDHKLTSSIRHYESEDKFDILVKIGEANSMLKELSDSSHFEVSPISDHKFHIKYVVQQNQQQLSEIDFQRVFKQIERRLNQYKNKNFWNADLSKDKQKISNFKGTMLLVLEEKDEITKQKISERIKMRDKELKSVLLETVNLKMMLEQQYQLLQKKGINSR